MTVFLKRMKTYITFDITENSSHLRKMPLNTPSFLDMGKKINHYTFKNPLNLFCVFSYLQNSFLLYFKINAAFNVPVCFFVHLCCHGFSYSCLSLRMMRLEQFSTFFSVALVTAALATSGFLQRSGCSFPCLHVLLCSCKLQAEGQGISVDLTLASPPSLILAICWMSELINLYHNHLRASDLSC